MSPRTQKIRELQGQIKGMTTEERESLTARVGVITIEGRSLSPYNRMLLAIQGNGKPPTVVGGYRQWKKAGKQVKKGEHGSLIWIPTGTKDKEGNIEEVDNFWTAYVFDISQTEEIQEAGV